jgi:ABC-type branched-subunit amino acid transport system ATPase component
MNIKLTKEQGDVVKFASTGHNMCLFGKAGVGKTTVVESIIKSMMAKGLKCQIVCSTGISCDAYCNSRRIKIEYVFNNRRLQL